VDVFGLRDRVIADYASYIRSFFTISDEQIRRLVNDALAEGHLWPDPLLQLSPAFEAGETIEELIAAGELHPETRKIFAIKREEDGSIQAPLRLHRHQVEGIRAARAGDSYVLTTGTGSATGVRAGVPDLPGGAWRLGRGRRPDLREARKAECRDRAGRAEPRPRLRRRAQLFCQEDPARAYGAEWYERIVRFEIEPLLEEYFAEDPDEVQRLVGELLT
jgi:hypothetical protein